MLEADLLQIDSTFLLEKWDISYSGLMDLFLPSFKRKEHFYLLAEL